MVEAMSQIDVEHTLRIATVDVTVAGMRAVNRVMQEQTFAPPLEVSSGLLDRACFPIGAGRL